MPVCLVNRGPGSWFNIKMSSYQYRKSHRGDYHPQMGFLMLVRWYLYIESGPWFLDNDTALHHQIILYDLACKPVYVAVQESIRNSFLSWSYPNSLGYKYHTICPIIFKLCTDQASVGVLLNAKLSNAWRAGNIKGTTGLYLSLNWWISLVTTDLYYIFMVHSGAAKQENCPDTEHQQFYDTETRLLSWCHHFCRQWWHRDSS